MNEERRQTTFGLLKMLVEDKHTRGVVASGVVKTIRLDLSIELEKAKKEKIIAVRELHEMLVADVKALDRMGLLKSHVTLATQYMVPYDQPIQSASEQASPTIVRPGAKRAMEEDNGGNKTGNNNKERRRKRGKTPEDARPILTNSLQTDPSFTAADNLLRNAIENTGLDLSAPFSETEALYGMDAVMFSCGVLTMLHREKLSEGLPSVMCTMGPLVVVNHSLLIALFTNRVIRTHEGVPKFNFDPALFENDPRVLIAFRRVHRSRADLKTMFAAPSRYGDGSPQRFSGKVGANVIWELPIATLTIPSLGLQCSNPKEDIQIYIIFPALLIEAALTYLNPDVSSLVSMDTSKIALETQGMQVLTQAPSDDATKESTHLMCNILLDWINSKKKNVPSTTVRTPIPYVEKTANLRTPGPSSDKNAEDSSDDESDEEEEADSDKEVDDVPPVSSNNIPEQTDAAQVEPVVVQAEPEPEADKTCTFISDSPLVDYPASS